VIRGSWPKRPRPAKQEGAQYERNFLCSHSVRHWRAREAPPCLPRPNGVGEELHSEINLIDKLEILY